MYNPSDEFAAFGLATHGNDFFGDVVLDAPKAIPAEDMKHHLETMSQENVIGELRANGMFTYEYRMLLGNGIVPASLKAVLVDEEDGEKKILGVMSGEDD